MSEETETTGQQNTSGQQAPPQENWEARYKGSVKKIEELVTANRSLQAQLEQSTSQIEQLKAELGLKETEKSVAIGERDKQLQDVLTKNQSAEAELAELRALQLKVDVIKELGRPELLRIAQHIPNLTDRDALKTVMGDFASFVGDSVKAREKELLAGYTPGAGTVQTTPKPPASGEEWMSHINSFGLGTKERQQALDDYGDWLEQTYSNRR